MDPSALIEVVHDEPGHRFVARLEGEEAYLRYHAVGDGVLDYVLSYTPPALRERHVASTIVRHALDYARESGFRVVPSCWFVAGYVKRHPEYRAVIEER